VQSHLGVVGYLRYFFDEGVAELRTPVPVILTDVLVTRELQ
jgi:hypothetical protein